MKSMPALLTILILFASLPVNTSVGDDEAVTPPALPAQIEAARTVGPFDVERVRERDGLRNGPGYRGATIYHPVKKVAADGDGDSGSVSTVATSTVSPARVARCRKNGLPAVKAAE